MKLPRNYLLLLGSQFWSAFGDNFIITIIVGPMMTAYNAHQISAETLSTRNIYYISLLFIPYVILAPLTGYLNDRFPKNRWLLGANAIKLAGTGLAAIPGCQGIGYFIVGIGAAIYSPAKYGILPEILPVERLVKANGTVEFLTLVAILSGSIGASWCYDNCSLTTCYLAALAIYAFSLVLNVFMSRTPSYPEVLFRHSVSGFFQNLRDLFSQKRLARILVGTATFWVCGAMMKMNFLPWGLQVLHLPNMLDISLLGLWLSIGVMIGSVLAGQFYPVGELRGTRLYGFLLAGTLAALGALDFLVHTGHPRQCAVGILIATGFVAGLFLIPLNAALQAESHQDKLGKTIATQNCFENFAMLCGSALAYCQVKVGFNPSQLFLGLAVFVTLIVFWLKIPRRPAT